tara:strand:- start:4046 stop:4447 length:402 start_codon:yes stop_codon:yes gene_type:complete
MGCNLSTSKYKIEISHLPYSENNIICCNLGIDDNIFSSESGFYVFKENNCDNPKWLLYEGILRDIVITTSPLYLLKNHSLNESKLTDFSLLFDTFYDLMKYTNNKISNKDFAIKLVAYNNSNINNLYLSEFIE